MLGPAQADALGAALAGVRDWSGVSALARTRRRRLASAWRISASNASQIGSPRGPRRRRRGPSRASTPRARARRRTPSPVNPSIVMWSPSATFVPCAVNVRAAMSILMPSAPHTAGMPSPRATTAAWELVPPARGQDALGRDHAVVVVRRGLAADQDHPLARAARSSASSAVNTTRPVAAPGEAFRPCAIGVALRGLLADDPLEQLLEAVRVHPQEGLVGVDEALVRACRGP